MSDLERFWAKVDKVPGHGPNGDCWEWRAGKYVNGYGCFYLGGRLVPAHRASHMLNIGPIPEGHFVRHFACDNPPCVRPDHLRSGLPAENSRDMREKGRGRGWRFPGGAENHAAKLRPGDLETIRARVAAGELQRDVARDFGVSRTTINRAVRGVSWKLGG